MTPMSTGSHIILIVEDESGLSGLLLLKLVRGGHNVSVAQNGQIGLEIYNRIHPDLVLLDIVMPVMDGAEFMKNLPAKHANIIVITNSHVEEAKVKAPGADAYLSKADNTLEEILDAINKMLE